MFYNDNVRFAAVNCLDVFFLADFILLTHLTQTGNSRKHVLSHQACCLNCLGLRRDRESALCYASNDIKAPSKDWSSVHHWAPCKRATTHLIVRRIVHNNAGPAGSMWDASIGWLLACCAAALAWSYRRLVNPQHSAGAEGSKSHAPTPDNAGTWTMKLKRAERSGLDFCKLRLHSDRRLTGIKMLRSKARGCTLN